MPIRPLYASLALMLFALPLSAKEIDLGALIASGKWALAYQRTGEFKPLNLKHQESGTSYTCIAGNARDKITGWVADKGCSIEKEAMVNGTYRLEGQCRLKWWRNHAIPVSIELRPESAARFSLSIRTRNDGLLGFTEQTTATLQGPCESPSAPQAEQHQARKG